MNAFDPSYGASIDTGSAAYSYGSKAGILPGGIRIGVTKLFKLAAKVRTTKQTKVDKEVKKVREDKEPGQIYEEISGAQKKAREQGKPDKIFETEKSRQKEGVRDDLSGLFPWFTPKFVSPEARVAEEIRKAVQVFIGRTKSENGKTRD